ncbi:hypothetical protein PQX77_011370 [Marasmius sp. AFHP31]|nr:hypothetical protein PQX77_011370 [Marasmius sp. AFHP31]
MGFSLTFRGVSAQVTWTDVSLIILVPGTSIAVYFILANGDYGGECDFILDGLLEGSYAWNKPPDKKGPEYNVEVFRKEGLENQLHTLDVEMGKKTDKVYIAFDYATYIQNGSTAASPSQSSDSDPSSSKRAPTGANVGGVIGGIALIVGALLVFFMCRKRRQLKHERPGNILQVDSFTASIEHAEEFSSAATVPVFQLPDVATAPALAPGPLEETSDISMRLQQQFDRMRERSSSLKSRGRHNGDVLLSGSSTIGSDAVQGEMAELREQTREFQVQMQILPQEPPLMVANTPPPSYGA